MTAQPAESLFSHPDTHRPTTRGVRPDEVQRSYTDLFREPADTPPPTSRND
ncbi:hypothetical protein [Saccharothrix obliqua]|uniref:hypothetical protein n=1 Tax=Saccharothrix obliqua TaxID=2861747 RepID=UPI001C5D5A30|nr:hypothetical protein [Saccharothrix obliqua]MBW4718580.1 hypothetical protein [Saccharothrix obliqua]